MSFQEAEVQRVVRGGVSIFCATCTKFWVARQMLLPEPQCTSSRCKGPMRGGNFEDYQGPILDFARFCFVCGAESDFGVRVQGKDRLFGMCDGHISYLVNLVPSLPTEDTPILLKKGGYELEVTRVIQPPKPTLLQEMMAFELDCAKDTS